MVDGRLEQPLSRRVLPEPPTLTVSTARFASPFPSPRRERAAGHLPTSPSTRSAARAERHTPTSSTAASLATTASLGSLPSELILAISAYLYLPPDEFSNAHSRSPDLCALGLASGRRVQAVIRAVLFRQVGLRSQSEVRFFVRRSDLASLVRSLAIQSSTIKHYLPLLLPLMPELSMLILSCKIALRDLALLEPPQPASPPDDGPLLAAALTSSMSSPAGEPASMPSLTSLRLELSEPLSAKLIKTLLRSSLVGKVEDLGISARFIRLGLMADVVELPEVELIAIVDELVRGLPTLRRLALPLTPAPNQVDGPSLDVDLHLGLESSSSAPRTTTDLTSSLAAVVSHTEGGRSLTSLPATPSFTLAPPAGLAFLSSIASEPAPAPCSLESELRSRFFPPLERLQLGGSAGAALEIEQKR